MVIKKRKIAAAFIRRTSGGFTLVELMVVILIVGILAVAAVPLMRGRSDQAKWTEANAACGTIWVGVRAYIAEKGPAYDYTSIDSGLDDATVCRVLGFNSSDLAGIYFLQKDYTISGVVASPPACVITVKSSVTGGPTGTATFTGGAADPWAVAP